MSHGEADFLHVGVFHLLLLCTVKLLSCSCLCDIARNACLVLMMCLLTRTMNLCLIPYDVDKQSWFMPGRT